MLVFKLFQVSSRVEASQRVDEQMASRRALPIHFSKWNIEVSSSEISEGSSGIFLLVRSVHGETCCPLRCRGPLAHFSRSTPVLAPYCCCRHRFSPLTALFRRALQAESNIAYLQRFDLEKKIAEVRGCLPCGQLRSRRRLPPSRDASTFTRALLNPTAGRCCDTQGASR